MVVGQNNHIAHILHDFHVSSLSLSVSLAVYPSFVFARLELFSLSSEYFISRPKKTNNFFPAISLETKEHCRLGPIKTRAQCIVFQCTNEMQMNFSENTKTQKELIFFSVFSIFLSRSFAFGFSFLLFCFQFAATFHTHKHRRTQSHSKTSRFYN